MIGALLAYRMKQADQVDNSFDLTSGAGVTPTASQQAALAGEGGYSVVLQGNTTGKQVYQNGTTVYPPIINQVSASTSRGTVVPTGGTLGRRLTLLPDSGQSMTVETLGVGGGVTQTFPAITSHTEFVTEAVDSAVIVYGFGTYSLI